MKIYSKEKEYFSKALSNFAIKLGSAISQDDQWTIKGFVDIF